MSLSTSHLQCIHLFERLSSCLPSKWQRDRGTLRPCHVLITIMHMSVLGYRGYRRTLREMTQHMGRRFGWEYAPAVSSFSEARRKLDASTCISVFESIRSHCTQVDRCPKAGYHDYRLVAIDGTRLELPVSEDLAETFGVPKTRIKTDAMAPQASLFVAWDVSHDVPMLWRLDRAYASERLAGYELAASFRSGDLLLLDRLYVSRRMIAQLKDQGADFLLRMTNGRAGSFLEVREFVASGAQEAIVRLHRTNQRRGAPDLEVRLLRRDLPGGEVGVWATTLLDADRHPADVVLALYQDRWQIETSFREMKIWHGLESFHARFADGIHQEVAAIMIFMTLAAELDAQARERLEHTVDEHGRIQYSHRVNRLMVSDSVVDLLAAGTKGPDEIRRCYEFSMREIWRSKQRIRKGRSFPRAAKSPSSKFKKTTWRGS